MAENKNQHFVTKAYLKLWNNENKKVFEYDLREKCIHENMASNICKKTYFYNVDDLGENKSVIDDLFQVVEADGIATIKKLISRDKITRAEGESIAWYVAAQAVRTPSQMNAHEELTTELAKDFLVKFSKDKDKINTYLESLESDPPAGVDIEAIKKNPEEYFRKISEEIKEGELKLKVTNKREIWLPTMAKMIPALAQDYLNGDWLLIRAKKGSSFITSDNPVKVTSYPEKSNDLSLKALKDTEISFPLSPKYLLLISRNGRGGFQEIVGDQEIVRQYNFLTVLNAERYIYSNNQSLLLSLAKKYRDDWENAYKIDGIRPYMEDRLPTIPLKSNKFKLLKRIKLRY